MEKNLSNQKTVNDVNAELLELYRKLLFSYENLLRSKQYQYSRHSLGFCQVIYDLVSEGAMTDSEAIKLREDLRQFKCRDDNESPYWFHNALQRMSILHTRLEQLIRNECTQSFKNRLKLNLGATRLNLLRYDNKA